MRVLLLSNKWPTPDRPTETPFLGEMAEGLKNAGVSFERFTFRGAKNPLNYLKAWRLVREQYNLDEFDVVHALFGQVGILGLPKRLPLVVTYYGSDLHGDVGPDGKYTAKGRVMRALSQLVARNASANIVVADHMNAYIPAGDAHVIPCGVNWSLFRPIPRDEARAQVNLVSDKCLVLFAANPNRPVKRFELAEAAMKIVQRTHPHVELLTVGGAPYDHMPVYMNAADLLLLTSKHEGSPTVIKEALACNRPIVSVDVGDVRQRLDKVDGCYVCEDDSAETVAQNIINAIEYGRPIDGRSAVADLDNDALARRIIQVYESVIK